jgi:hypothetical protein
MERTEAVAWLARRLVWEDRLRDLDARGGEPTVLLGPRDPRTGRDLNRADGGRPPLAWAS